MPFQNPEFASSAGTPRHTVRIVRRRVPPKAAWISLLLAAIVAGGVYGFWRLWRSEPPLQFATRRLTEFELDWRCEGGHRFRALGQIDPKQCSTCQKTSYPVADFACPQHGVFEVSGKFARNKDGPERMTHYRLPGRSWVSADDPLPCPKCGQELVRAWPDPLAPRQTTRKRSGG